jgi:hypothetical protein
VNVASLKSPSTVFSLATSMARSWSDPRHNACSAWWHSAQVLLPTNVALAISSLGTIEYQSHANAPPATRITTTATINQINRIKLTYTKDWSPQRNNIMQVAGVCIADCRAVHGPLA